MDIWVVSTLVIMNNTAMNFCTCAFFMAKGSLDFIRFLHENVRVKHCCRTWRGHEIQHSYMTLSIPDFTALLRKAWVV